MDVILLTEATQNLLGSVAHDVFDYDLRADQLAEFLKCPRHCMLLAVDEGLVVGMASGVEYFHPDKPPQLWINEIAVSGDYQNRGIGRQLTRKMIDLARSRGCASAWLGTDTSNHPAQRCFGSVASGKLPAPFLLYEWDLQPDEEA